MHCSPTCKHTRLQNASLFTVSKSPFQQEQGAVGADFSGWQSSSKLGRPRSQGWYISSELIGLEPLSPARIYSLARLWCPSIPWLTAVSTSTAPDVEGTGAQLAHPWENRAVLILNLKENRSRTCHLAEMEERGGWYRLHHPNLLLFKYWELGGKKNPLTISIKYFQRNTLIQCHICLKI